MSGTKTAELYRMVMEDHLCPYGLKSKHLLGYTDLMVDGAPSPHQSDTTLRWLIDRLRS